MHQSERVIARMKRLMEDISNMQKNAAVLSTGNHGNQ